jgi:hypothetical protein
MQHNRVEARRRHAHCCDFLSFAGLGDAVSRSPGEPRGIVGGKENSDAGDVVRLPVATERRACDRRFFEIAAYDAPAMRALGLDAARLALTIFR